MSNAFIGYTQAKMLVCTGANLGLNSTSFCWLHHPIQTRDNDGMQPSSPDTKQARNPLHGLTLEAIVTQLADHYGWDDLGTRIPIRCFTHDPSVGSSLKFLRKTPWARDKVESLYLFMLRDQKRQQRTDD